ncbi:hypothetical protein [Clostridium frigidicarnis]|uniref:Uncharacterized protein n=1 Tax=Clostridium frigidicarnis TaxID=84698 RepID=A0A1I0V5C3_9CLOT|nr:hypothetical protein [Clostridium frigidicarnis]SFA70756.1 hypothetical protein SAMN04488528_1001129 [Clostridium frigidicarnis]
MNDMKKAWEYLNSHGIYTMEQFKEECKKVKINIGVFVTPLSNENQSLNKKYLEKII